MFSLSVTEIWGGVAALLFPLSPVIMKMPLTGRSRRRRSLPNAAQFLVVWVFLLFVRLSQGLLSEAVGSFLIPEPLNTVLFAATGAVLLALIILPRVLGRRRLWAAPGDARHVDDLMSLSPREFEEMVVELYTALGHTARRTGAVGDHGVDVVVKAKNGEKWVVQCKRWRGNVGEPIVRDFYGVVHHEKADRGTLITSGGFTEQARAWAKGKPLTLVDGPQFMKYMKGAREMKMAGAGSHRSPELKS
jgi:HJR/Mrr/RecB family endonuclease